MATAKPEAANRALLRGRRWPRAVLLVAVLVAGLAWVYRAPIAGYAITGAAYSARVGCACRYIEGRSLKQCKDDFEPGMELVSISDDDAAKSVTGRMLFLASQTATYRPGYGCVLEKWQG